MINKQLQKIYRGWLATGLFTFLLISGINVNAQNRAPSSTVIEAQENAHSSEYVTINVRDANIAEVLKAYSLQTGQSIVVGPDVLSDNVNVRLNNIPWEEALDVILKPYGFGYRVVGDTIIISKLENIVTVEGIEPLISKVFTLKFLDAYDIQAVCEAQLSNRGKFTVLATKSMPGWEFGGAGTSGAATEGGIRSRKEKQEIKKSKVFVISDVPSAVTKVDRILAEMDVLPQQILIEAKFMEISNEGLKDIGLNYASAIEEVNPLTVTSDLAPIALDATEDLQRLLNLTTGYTDPLNAGMSANYGFDSGLRLSSSQLFGTGVEALIAFMAQDDAVNILSAPHILTVNNQEAAILVGQKFPIIESESTSGSGSGVTSTSLDYYENIGIQLNVIPQICDGGYVNMIIHPAVSEIDSFEAGVVTADSGAQSGSRYPVLNIREAETQILVKSENTAVIGGLQKERTDETIEKVPFLGDIPFLGRLFRRETTTRVKIDLLIFIKATIINNDEYAATSKDAETVRTEIMNMELLTAEAPESVDLQDEDGDEIIALVEEMDSSDTGEVDSASL